MVHLITRDTSDNLLTPRHYRLSKHIVLALHQSEMRSDFREDLVKQSNETCKVINVTNVLLTQNIKNDI